MLIKRLLILPALALLLLGNSSWAGQQTPQLRFGYLDDQGSALILLAQQHGHFKKERLSVTLVKYSNADAAITALTAGKIEAGAFPANAVLKAIAANNELQIIAGGGTPKPGVLQAELDRSVGRELQAREVVTVIRSSRKIGSKETATRLVRALIRAYQELQEHEATALQSISHRLSNPPLPDAYSFNPNPDYYRFAAIWEDQELQRPGMRRDHLASHLFEEIYCDALDRAVDADPQNGLLRKLAAVAVCTPDCCPDAKKRTNKRSKGAAS